MKKVSCFISIIIAFLLLSPNIACAGELNFKLKPLEGKGKIELSKTLESGPVLAAFWATWCHPCQDELVQIQKIYEVYRDSGISFFAISIDDAKTAGKVKTVAAGKRLTIPILLDPEQEAMQAFGLSNVPGVFIVGQEGKLLYQHIGYKPGDEVGLEENIKAIVGRIRKPENSPLPDSSALSDTTTTSGKEDK
jgi:peroxiredoxin